MGLDGVYADQPWRKLSETPSLTLASEVPLDLFIEKFWLGGLDSNQDNQIQSLMYYRLYDLPAVTDFRSLRYLLRVEKWRPKGHSRE